MSYKKIKKSLIKQKISQYKYKKNKISLKQIKIHKNLSIKNNINSTSNSTLNFKLNKSLENIYKNINFNPSEQTQLINTITLKKNTFFDKYNTNLCIINIYNNCDISKNAIFKLINELDIPKDNRTLLTKEFLKKLCKWIDIYHHDTYIKTCILIWISDRFIWNVENVDKRIPICVYATPINLNYIIIPDNTFYILNEQKRYASTGLDWAQQKKLFTYSNTKKNLIFFRGVDTTNLNHNLRQVIKSKLNYEKDKEFKKAMKYEFLTHKNYKSVKEFKEYKFLLNLPGRYPWSTRLKYLYLSKSFIINIRVKTLGDVNDDVYNSFVDLLVPDNLCINIDMNYYYNDNDNNDPNKYVKQNIYETNKVYEKIKQIYHQYKNKNPIESTKVQEAYDLINKLDIKQIYQYYYKMICLNQKIGLVPM
jgi:hypothetical protein